jgi:shikimate kinase
MRIVLIGFRGTGKSVLGKKIAKELKYSYISTDKLIKASFSLSITEIIEKYGWRKFRAREAKIIAGLKNEENCIIDTGGGSILTKTNRNNLSHKSFVIQLCANKKDLVKRISEGKDRPKLTAKSSIEKEVSQLLKERKELYDSITDLKLNTSKIAFRELKKITITKIKGLL